MKKLKTLKSITLLLIVSVISMNQAYSQINETTGTLTVTIIKIQDMPGKVVVHLYKKGDDVKGKPYLKTEKAINKKEETVVFNNLPYGNYVALAFHDKNSNQKLDHNYLGFPNEPFGYSNNWNFSVFSGMPTYEKTKFVFSKDKKTIIITLK